MIIVLRNKTIEKLLDNPDIQEVTKAIRNLIAKNRASAKKVGKVIRLAIEACSAVYIFLNMLKTILL